MCVLGGVEWCGVVAAVAAAASGVGEGFKLKGE